MHFKFKQTGLQTHELLQGNGSTSHVTAKQSITTPDRPSVKASPPPPPPSNTHTQHTHTTHTHNTHTHRPPAKAIYVQFQV